MAQYFITGTGTDIGKTWIAAALIRHARARGRALTVLKPVLSGFDPQHAERSDAGVLLEALGEPCDASALDRIAPWRYAAPLSPDMAAAREGRTVPFDKVVDHCRAVLAQAQEGALIEGVGGCMVPLDARRTVRDWIAALDLPALLVCGSYLGAMSHTLTALAALRAAALPVAALVVNESEASTVDLADTVASLATHAPDVPLFAIPRRAPDSALDRLGDFLFP